MTLQRLVTASLLLRDALPSLFTSLSAKLKPLLGRLQRIDLLRDLVLIP